MLINQLKLLGYHENEAKIIIALVNYGPGPVSIIARNSGVARSNAYNFLDDLVEKNILIKYSQSGKMQYAINSVDKITQRQVFLDDIAVDVVRRLKSLQSKTDRLNIEYFVGEEGYKFLYEDILNSKATEILTCINIGNFADILGSEFEETWTNNRVAKNIKARLLLVDSDVADELISMDAELLRETRVLPKNCDFKTTYILYGDHLVIFENNDGDISGLRINSAETAKTFRQIFNLVWKQSTK